MKTVKTISVEISYDNKQEDMLSKAQSEGMNLIGGKAPDAFVKAAEIVIGGKLPEGDHYTNPTHVKARFRNEFIKRHPDAVKNIG